MSRKFAAIGFSLGCLHASYSYAIGLGELTLESFLNEPLKAQVEILNAEGLNEDQIRIRLATKEDFDRMGVERAYFLTSIQFDVQFDAAGSADIIITSDDPVLEPYLDFIIEARWPTGRLLREYTVLVDPPVFDTSTPVVSASRRVEEVEGIPAPDSTIKKPQDPAATSGTRVDVGTRSTLAPGEMPNRDFNAAASPTPVAGARYMIHRDDTLWEIADSAKPAGTTVHQTMLDIQRLNPDAFIDGNINRIKAGYIIYLPTQDDISSSDLAAALAEVRQQNEDWEAGRASKPIASTGPKLRISADPVEEAAQPGNAEVASTAAGDELAAAELERQDMAEQLASMEQQVETLQRIVSLKDDQIAALQQALAEAGAAPVDVAGADAASDLVVGGDAAATEDAVDAMDEADPMAEEAAEASGEDSMADTDGGESAEVAPVAAAPAPAPQPQPAPAPAQASEGGLISYLFYGLGALVLGILAFLFLRRRGADDEAQAGADTDRAFAAVQLKEEPVETVPEASEPVPAPEPEPEPEPEPLAEIAQPTGTRGYGERKHDEYASDVEASDALAEADIYIAYGRYPQAIDLLKTAVSADPGNPAYRLKLLELYLQTDNRAAAELELAELEAIGDAGSVDRARALLGGAGSETPMSEPPAGLAEELSGGMEADFADLEIETTTGAEDLDDDLDLSADFSDDSLGVDDEDLVIAADANGMSTKLDLARAYLDMGDEDGARQILEEVVAEGNDEQKAEASELLERIG